MWYPRATSIVISVLLTASVSLLARADCDNVLTSSYNISMASGWSEQLIIDGLTKPRGIMFDQSGNLLVVDSGVGVIQYQLDDNGGTCLSVTKKTYLVNSTDLNHGIALSNDGKTLYASSSNTVYSWTYDADAGSVSDTNTTLVTGMSNDDHTTRTLLYSADGTYLLVSRGSNSNIDDEALDLSSGHSQIRAFNLTNTTADSPYKFDTDGRLLGWGLRNSVAVAQHPLTGGVFSAENSVDQITRNGEDIHEDNPGEELNFHGFLNSSTTDQGGNYGYPSCFAAWAPADIPDSDLVVGAQFVMAPNSTLNDTTCAEEFVPPVLTFQAHMAPLDLLFTPAGTTAYISFHGSWDRTDPVGYKVSSIAWGTEDGTPMVASTSTTSLTDIMTNGNNSVCPDSCFRPVGLALDAKGRLFVSSDATGEIYVLDQTNATTSASTTSSASGTGATATATQKGEGMEKWKADYSLSALWVAFAVICFVF